MPELNGSQKLAKRLNLSEERVLMILNQLVEMGLVQKMGSEYKVKTLQIHLGSDSGLISQHHTNWRVRALSSLSSATADDVHYSSAITLFLPLELKKCST